MSQQQKGEEEISKEEECVQSVELVKEGPSPKKRDLGRAKESKPVPRPEVKVNLPNKCLL